MKTTAGAAAIGIALIVLGPEARAQDAGESGGAHGLTTIDKTQNAEQVLNVFNVKTAFSIAYSFDGIAAYRRGGDGKVLKEDGTGADRLAFATMISFSLTLAGNSHVGWDVFYPTFIQTVDSKIQSEVAPLGIGTGINWRLGKRSTAVSVNIGLFKTKRDVLTAEADLAYQNNVALGSGDALTRQVGSLVGFISFGVMP